MSAADLHAEALARIAEQRALIAAGTPTPWFQGRESKQFESVGDVYSTRDPEDDVNSHDIATMVYPTENAALIVAAVNDYGPLLDLAEAVLLRHAPIHRLGGHVFCWDCTSRTWPCREATAALSSIGLGS